ncbi:MAG: hypothetical protein EOM15_02870 [Spirochaetia bacterium]|nr:hypothetical protein [Spirochaetia bacterium]
MSTISAQATSLNLTSWLVWTIELAIKANQEALNQLEKSMKHTRFMKTLLMFYEIKKEVGRTLFHTSKALRVSNAWLWSDYLSSPTPRSSWRTTLKPSGFFGHATIVYSAVERNHFC